MNNFDSYDTAQLILELWQKHCQKNSGELHKDMTLPIRVMLNNQPTNIKNIRFNDDIESPAILLEL